MDSNNKDYSSQDGILFNKDKTALVCYPEGKADKSYVIPNSVTSIGSHVFEDWTNRQTITVWWQEGNEPSGWDSDWNEYCQAQIIYNGGQ